MKKHLQNLITLSLLLFTIVGITAEMENFSAEENSIAFFEIELEGENFLSLEKKSSNHLNISGGNDFENFESNFTKSSLNSLFFQNKVEVFGANKISLSNCLVAKYILNCSLIFYA